MKGYLLLLLGLIIIKTEAALRISDYPIKNKYEQLLIDEDYEQLEAKFVNYLSKLDPEGDWEEKIIVYIELSDCKLYTGDIKKGLAYLDKSKGIISSKAIQHKKDFQALLASKYLYFNSIFGNIQLVDQYKNVVEQFISQKKLGAYVSYFAHFAISVYFQNKTVQLDSALFHSKRSLAYLNKSPGVTIAQIAVAEFIVASQLYLYGKFEQSKKFAIPSLKKSQSIQYAYGMALCYELLGGINRYFHNYESALGYFQRIDAKNLYSKANKLVWMSVIYLELDDYKNAKSCLRQAITLFKSVNIGSGSFTSHLAHAYDFLGLTFEQENKIDSALFYHFKVLKMRKELFGEEHMELIYNYQNLGKAFAGYNNSKSSHYLRKAVAISSKLLTEKHNKTAESYRLLAETLAETAIKEALNMSQKSIICALKSFEEVNFEQNPPIRLHQVIYPLQLLKSISTKAELLHKYYSKYTKKQKELNLAHQTYQLAVQLADSIRLSFQSEKDQVELANTTASIYKGAIQNLIQLFNQTRDQIYLRQAFEISEKSKAMVLFNGMMREHAISTLPNEMILKEENLKAELNYCLSKMDKLIDSSNGLDQRKLTSLKNQEHSLRDSLALFLTELEEKFPQYYQSKYHIPKLNIEAIQNHLEDNQKIVSYYEGDTNWIAFVIAPDEFLVKVLLKLPNEQDIITQFRKSISSNAFIFTPNESWMEYSTSATQLYASWLEPLANYFNENDHLIIIPYGKMALIPFEALLVSVPNNKNDFNALDYFIKHATISYANSARLWYNEQQKQISEYHNKILAFAPSFEQSSSQQNTKSGNIYQDTVRGSLAPLKWATKELDLVAKYFEGQYYINKFASEATFKSQAAAADIIHIASHAIAQDLRPMYSKIYFTENEDTVEDAALHTYELYNLNLKAKLAVLSACNTGYGKAVEGEGIINLARGFFYAGCPSVVMSLWNANDQSTAEIMGKFYANLDQANSKDVALKQAKLDYLRDASAIKAHPYYWAQFVANGDMRPIVKQSYAIWVWVLVILALIPVVFLLKKRIFTR